jgi:type IV pilus assembly protein PilO
MTAGGDFIPNDQAFDSAPEYPVVFGLRFTPVVTGIMLALLGLAGAGALLVYLVMPEWEAYQQLKTQVEATEAQLQQQETIKQQINTAKQNLDVAKKQRDDVLTLFANEASLDTLLLDLNRQVDARNADLTRRREQKLAQCPALVQQNVQEFEDKVGPIASQARLKTFTPAADKSTVITDGSYGSLVNGKLKRQVANVELVGNYNQTSAILQSIERLQPLLVIRNLSSVADEKSKGFVPLAGFPNCVPDTQITTKFQLEALLPLSATDRAATPAAQPGQPPR